jgi:hypothetical protein
MDNFNIYDMKYLKLYEAFSSNTLSKLYNHLKKKNATKTSLTQFKSDMKSIASSFDVPMDQISDEDVSYLSRRKALGLRNEEKVQNESGIWAIKFWFDKDGEYIGTSGTGNDTFEFDAIPKHTGKQCKPFTKEQWVALRAARFARFPRTGMLNPVLEDEYASLKNGDEVIAVLCDPDYYEDEQVDHLTWGKIFIDNDREIYIVHDNDNCDGMSPDDDPAAEYPDTEWGSYTWKIYGYRPAEDHFNLHRVLKSDSPLRYYSDKKEEEEKKETSNPFEFNLSLEEDEDGGVRMASWSGNIDEKIKIEKEADFAVILYIDDILKRGLKSPMETNIARGEARKGATALMTDDEFKKANLERFMSKVVEKIGVTPESVELKSLQKVVANIVSSGISESYAFLGIITRDYRSIDSFSYQIKRLVSCLSVEGGETMLGFVYGEFAKEYQRMKRQSSEAYKNKKTGMDVLKERVELKPLYDAIMRISSKITKSILSKEIVRGEDLKKIFFKLASIEDMTRDDDFIFTYKLRDFIDGIRYAASDKEHVRTKVDNLIGNYCDLESDDGKTDLQRDLGRLKEIESYIDDIMK